MVVEGYKDTEIGVIPIEWEVKSLSEIGSFSKGKGISKNEVIEDGIPCMRYAEIYTEYDTVLKDIKSFIDEKSALNSKQLNNGDILFAGSGETLDDIGKSVAFIDDFEAYVGGDTVILSSSIDYNSLFMAYQLNSTSVRTQLRKLGQGSSVVHIYSSGLEKITVPFPPLKEQEKIADILSTADDKIDAIALQLDRAETLKKGLLQKLLSEGLGHSEFKDSEIGKIPLSWEVSKLEDISDFITKGATPTTYGFSWEETGIPFLRSECVSDNGLVMKAAMFISDEAHKHMNRSEIKNGDLLMTITGNVGRVILLQDDISMGNINQHIARIRISSNQVDTKFIYQYVSQDKYRLNYYKITTGQAYPQISLKQVRNSIVPLPPLEEQKQIANILSTADEKLEVLRAKKQKYETLKKGLLQKLLSGEVRTV